LALHFQHHRQSAVCARADHQPPAVPRYFFFDGDRRVPKVIAKFLGRLLPAFADLPIVDHDIVLVHTAVNPKRAKGEFVEMHMLLLGDISRALLRSDRGESGPTLLDALAAAAWALHLAFLVVDERQNLREELLAVQAEEFVVGHGGTSLRKG